MVKEYRILNPAGGQVTATFGRHHAAILTAAGGEQLWVPEGFAHGNISLADDIEITYRVSQFYAPGSERGVLYNDPAFGIEWPVEVRVISDKDKSWARYSG